MFRHYKHSHGLSNSSSNSFNTCKIGNCSAYFKTLIQLTYHLKSQHGLAYQGAMVNDRLKCEDCHKTYKNIYGLRFHRKKAHSEETNLFRCSVPNCDIEHETEQELQSHIQYKHSSSKMDFVECPKCKKSLNGTGSLTRHMKIHDREEHGPAPISTFVCETCGKCFKHKRHLVQHSLCHSGPESWKFACNVCSKKCMTVQKLEEHTRTHSKEKLFVCQICGQKYAHRHNLRIHANNKHGDVVQAKPRKFDKANLPSKKKGIKRKRMGDAAKRESYSSESDTD